MLELNSILPSKAVRLLLEVMAFGGLILAIGLPRWVALNRFVTTDERLWLERSGNFYYALAHHNYAATYQKSHPGVTVMWAGLVGYLAEYPRYRESQSGQNRPVGLNTLERREFDLPLRILVAGRRTMVVFHVLALCLGFLFARRLFGTLPALAGFLLIAFDPFHIALSKVLHLDGLLADLTLLSLLAFLVYLEGRSRAALVVSAVAAGLAWLTKSPGLFLAPLIVLLALFDLLRRNRVTDQASWQKPILGSLSALAAWGAIAVLMFFLLWPAMWVDPVGSLTRVFTDAMDYAQGGHDSPLFFNGKIYPDGEIPDLSYYPVSFLWRTTPVTLLGLLAAPALLFGKKPVSRVERGLRSLNRTSLETQAGWKGYLLGMGRRKWAAAALLLFALGFSLLINLGLKKFDRYILPSIAPLDLLAGVSLALFAGRAAQSLRAKWPALLAGMLLLGLISVQAWLAWRAFPYFFDYYNPLLGGGRQAIQVLQIGWGEGLDQAARYINNKPKPDQIRVIAWYGEGPFSYFSKSQVIPLNVNHEWSDADWDQFNESDFAVVYIHEWQRNMPAEVLERLKDWKPEYSVWIGGLEYARVYKIH